MTFIPPTNEYNTAIEQNLPAFLNTFVALKAYLFYADIYVILKEFLIFKMLLNIFDFQVLFCTGN